MIEEQNMNQFKTQFDVITQINDWFFLDLVKSFIKKFWDLFCPLLLWVSLSLKVVLLYLIIGEQGKIKTEQGTGIEFFMLQATKKGPLFWGINWPVQPLLLQLHCWWLRPLSGSSSCDVNYEKRNSSLKENMQWMTGTQADWHHWDDGNMQHWLLESYKTLS